MGLVTGAVAAGAFLAGASHLSRRYFMAPSGVDERHFVRTEDGWRISVSRWHAGAPARRHPVLLCHGLASTHRLFDLLPQFSLARHLAARGYDVWGLDLRGHGPSERPLLFSGRRYEWDFDAYLTQDVPAALGRVLLATGARAVHWIGHSMGGILLYGHLARGGSPQVCSGVTIGSSLDYSAGASDFKRLLKFRGIARWVPVLPMETFARLMAPLAGRIDNPLERFNAWPPNLEPRLTRRLLATTYHNVPTALLAQLATAFEPGGLRSADGTVCYLDGLVSATAPVLALAGDRDRQCPPEAVAATVDALGSPGSKMLVFGADHGQQDHYGHNDLLIGRRVVHEVFPAIDGWLDLHDSDPA
jgi:alpha-beta hydrolase superfamily lysophospholipase